MLSSFSIRTFLFILNTNIYIYFYKLYLFKYAIYFFDFLFKGDLRVTNVFCIDPSYLRFVYVVLIHSSFNVHIFLCVSYCEVLLCVIQIHSTYLLKQRLALIWAL